MFALATRPIRRQRRWEINEPKRCKSPLLCFRDKHGGGGGAPGSGEERSEELSRELSVCPSILAKLGGDVGRFGD